MISAVIKVLVSIKTTVAALCRRDANLFAADVAITFILKKFKEANHFISQKLHLALVLRMQQRRSYMSAILQYLLEPMLSQNLKWSS